MFNCMLIYFLLSHKNTGYSMKSCIKASYLKTSVVEGGEDGDSRVDVLQFSQESSVKVRVHVAVDPEVIR